jgi:hypothetical protein
MKLPARNLVALVLTAIYLAITMSPLAPLALKSPRLAHAITGECSGDCDICGCSPERRANHTCCCWQKKLRHQHEQEEANLPPCCRKTKRSAGPILTCNCPCGSNKTIGLWGGSQNEQLPYRFAGVVPVCAGEQHLALPLDRLADRHGDPPDPPPKLADLC